MIVELRSTEGDQGMQPTAVAQTMLRRNLKRFAIIRVICHYFRIYILVASQTSKVYIKNCERLVF